VDQPQGQRLPLRDLALALSIAGLWGVNFVVMKHAVSEVPPLLLTALRFGLAALPAVFFIRKPDVPWRAMIAYGTAFGIVKFALLFTAFRLGSPAGLTSVMLQTQAIFTIVFAGVLFGERVNGRQIAGVALAATGMAAIISGASGGAALVPTLLVLAAAIAWGLANLVLKRIDSADVFAFTVWTSLVPPLPMLALSAVVEGVDAWRIAFTQMTWLGLAAVLYLAYPISLAGGVAWGSLLARFPAVLVTPFALLVPVIGIASGAVVYGERLTLANMAGSALVLTGLAVIVFAASNRISQNGRAVLPTPD